MKSCLFVVMLAVGCGGSKPAAAPPPSSPTTFACADAVQKSLTGASDPDPAFAARLVSLCESEPWSEDSKRCFVEAKTSEAGAKCESTFTESQRKNIADALAAAADAATGAAESATP